MTDLKVLYVIDSLAAGGAERSLAALAPWMIRSGVDLTVAYLVERPGLHEQFRAGGARVVSLDGDGGRVAASLRIARLARGMAPDVIHTTLFESDLTGRAASVLTGVPVVSTLPAQMYDREHLNDPSLSWWKVRAARFADMTTAQRVRRFHAVSGDVAESMAARLRVPRERIDVIPRGRDPEALGERSEERRAGVRAALGVSPEATMVFCAARQEHKKGLDVLLESMPAVLRSAHDTRLFIAGRPGAQTPLLQSLVARYGLGDHVTFLGARSDIGDLLAACDLCVVPSVSEGFPGIVLEAMALEAPLVGSDLGILREILGPLGDGRLASPKDPTALAGVMMAALADRGTTRRVAAEARDRFLERFAIGSVAEAMIEFYDRALSRNGNGARASSNGKGGA